MRAALMLMAVLMVACSSSGSTTATGSVTPSGSSSGSPTSSLTGACANDYFPVVAGASWRYDRTTGQKSTPLRQMFDSIGDDGFTVILLLPGGGERQIWECAQAGLANVEGYVTGPGGGPPLAGTVQFRHFRSRGVSVPSDLNVGSSWTQIVTSHASFMVGGTRHHETQVVSTAYRAEGEESVTTPAGTFQALKITITTTTHKTAPDLGVDLTDVTHSTQWWTSGVGVVRSVIDAGSGIPTTIDLQLFDIP